MVLIIKYQRCTWRLRDLDVFMEMPLGNIRKLWRWMFKDISRNSEPIAAIREWLPNIIAETGADVSKAEAEKVRTWNVFTSCPEWQKDAIKKARKDMRDADARFKEARREHERANKLKNIFNEFLAKYQ